MLNQLIRQFVAVQQRTLALQLAEVLHQATNGTITTQLFLQQTIINMRLVQYPAQMQVATIVLLQTVVEQQAVQQRL